MTMRTWRLPGAAYLAALGVALFLFLLSWPIFAGDTDLWYHLAAGRSIIERGSIPRHAVGTFLQRPWIDYSWLFQLIAWSAHAAGGYVGLVLLRAALFVALAGAVVAVLRPCRRPAAAWRVAVCIIALLVLLPRFASLRPQLVALVLLAVALLALERGGRLWALPAVGVLWANAHGVSWPVFAVVLAAYGAELAWQRLRQQAPADFRARANAIAAAAAALLVTPHGIALLRLPFTSLDFASRMIEELGPLPAAAYTRFAVEGLVPSRQTLFNLLALAAVFALVEQAARRKLRLAHVVLVAGAVLLLSRGSRFVCESALLALPLLAGWEPPTWTQREAPRFARAGVLVLLGLVPFVTLEKMRYPGRYPLSTDNLPTGVTTFLERAGHGGTIFNFPDLAGWLEWRLAPRYRIFADLQTPFPYDDVDTFLAIGATADRVVLGRVLARYRPDFLAIGIDDREAPAHLDPRWGYRPVAFDWTTVLYAHRQSQRDLVAQYELRAIDPCTAVAGEPRPGAPPDLARAELEQLAGIDTSNSAVAVALARLQLAAGDASSALGNAKHATTTTPLHAEGWLTAGDANVALRRYREAVDDFETARKRGGPEGRIGRQLWLCWTKLGEPRRAYRELDRVVDPVSSSTSFVDLLALGETAAAIGDREAAERNLTFALWKAPDEASQRRAAAGLDRAHDPGAGPISPSARAMPASSGIKE
ncbi:MAG TPA: hypothetical protein VGS57_19810 [Thermoanaerobaculia bacterium]|jgi:tetratricopeptide (TPR) repeat protein|nr:hypothetical protein [Thermoanaerobaculia bacterium]